MKFCGVIIAFFKLLPCFYINETATTERKLCSQTKAKGFNFKINKKEIN